MNPLHNVLWSTYHLIKEPRACQWFVLKELRAMKHDTPNKFVKSLTELFHFNAIQAMKFRLELENLSKTWNRSHLAVFIYLWQPSLICNGLFWWMLSDYLKIRSYVIYRSFTMDLASLCALLLNLASNLNWKFTNTLNYKSLNLLQYICFNVAVTTRSIGPGAMTPRLSW